MNTVVTSKEAILKASRNLVQTQGWGAVNIRTVASACGISVGSIYNYFPSKSDLMKATVESVWCDIFHTDKSPSDFDSFEACIQWAFDSMKKGEKTYPEFFTLHSMSFVGKEKADGQQRMAQSWQHIQEGLCQVLKQDKKVQPDVFDESFTPEAFVEIIFSLILSALLRHSYDCTGILGMIRRTLYH